MQIVFVVLACGGFGGLVNALLAGYLHLPRRDEKIYQPGWIGSTAVGAIAALIFWALYEPVWVIGTAVTGVLTIAKLAALILTGLGAARIFSVEVRRRLQVTPDKLAATK